MSNIVERMVQTMLEATIDNTQYLARIEGALQQEQLEKTAAGVNTTLWFLPLVSCEIVKLGAGSERRESVTFLPNGGALLVGTTSFDPVGESNKIEGYLTANISDVYRLEVLYIPTGVPQTVKTSGNLWMASYCPSGSAAGTMNVNILEAVYSGGLPSAKYVESAYHEAAKSALR